jgi:ABC-type polysaccharide/polyol phosphate export permease
MMADAVLSTPPRSASISPTARRRIGGQRDTLASDFIRALRMRRVWLTLGVNDIRQRYRRSVLGPLWITLSMAVLVATLGVIYSQVFHTEIRTYLPFLCLGFVIWGFFATAVSECCKTFQENAGIILQLEMPYSVYILRTVWRNFVVFLHTIIIFIPVALLFGVPLRPGVVLALPGMLLLLVNTVWIGLVVAIFSTRFRDVPLIVANILQILFFSTPIIWHVSGIGQATLLADLNPMYHLIELVRAPLLGEQATTTSWLAAAGLLGAGSIAAILLFRRVSRRIVYWL